jgi:hypothetical protein
MATATPGSFGKKEEPKENKSNETQSGSGNVGGSYRSVEEGRDEWRPNPDRPQEASFLGSNARPNLREVTSSRSESSDRDEPMSSGRDDVSELAQRAQNLALNTRENMASLFRRYPTQSLVVGLLVGVAIGLTISRRGQS